MDKEKEFIHHYITGKSAITLKNKACEVCQYNFNCYNPPLFKNRCRLCEYHVPTYKKHTGLFHTTPSPKW